MKLQELIDTLKGMPSDAFVRLDCGFPAGELMSWRGVYSELTLTWGDKDVTVADVLADAESAVGATFTGYKGGEYEMSGRTPVWADDYGLCSYNALMGASLVDGVVVLATADVSDYR